LSMVWMQPVHFSFLHGLDATSPFFYLFCTWSVISGPFLSTQSPPTEVNALNQLKFLIG
jgi:hypothetical protein